MKKAEIVLGDTSKGYFGTSTKYTGLSQRETLERIIINLSSCLGVKEVYRLYAEDGTFYEPQKPVIASYQRATNTILMLSEKLLEKQENRKATNKKC